MAVKQYEANTTCAFPRKDGQMLSIVTGNIYELDLGDLHKHHHDFLTPLEVPAVKKPARKKPAPKADA